MRFFLIIRQYFWFDEAFTVEMFAWTRTILGWIKFDEPIPPLNYWVIFQLSKVSTNSVWLRIPGFLLSIVSFLLIYKLARKKSKKAGLIALLLSSVSNYHLIYSFQSYVYPYLEFFVVISLFLFRKIYFEGIEKNKYFFVFLFFAANICGWFTQYVFIFYLTVLGLFVLTDRWVLKNKRKNFLIIFWSFLGFALVFLSYLPIFLNILTGGFNKFYSEPVSFRMFFSTILFLLGMANYWFLYSNLVVAIIGTAITIIVFILGIVHLLRNKKDLFFVLNFCIFFGITGFLFILSFFVLYKSLFQYRMLVVVFPSLVLVLTDILAEIKNIWIRKLLFVLAILYFLFQIFLAIYKNTIRRESFLATGKDSFIISECLKNRMEKEKKDNVRFIFTPEYIAPEFIYFWFDGNIDNIKKYNQSKNFRYNIWINYNSGFSGDGVCRGGKFLCRSGNVKSYQCME